MGQARYLLMHYFEPPSTGLYHMLLRAQYDTICWTLSQDFCNCILEMALLNQVVTLVEQKQDAHSRRAPRGSSRCGQSAVALFAIFGES
jgi:hypothetical protein